MTRTTKWLLVLGGFAVLFVFVCVLAAFSVGGVTRVPGRSVLWVRMGPEIPEEDRRTGIEKALGRRALTVRDYLRLFRAAAEDRRVCAVVLEPQGFGGGWAIAEEIRDAVLRLRESGKPVYAYLEVTRNLDYFVASAADHVVMLPTGMWMVTGLMADVPFYRGMLGKIGIEADLEHIGAYKSASDTYMRESMSDAQREATNLILDGIYGRFLSAIAEARSLERGSVASAVDEGLLVAERAKELKLVDSLGYTDEILGQIEAEVGGRVKRIKASAYFDSLREPRGGEKLALVYVTGVIVSGSSLSDPLAGALVGSDTIAEALRKVREDRAIRAVIVRVDSPGGSGLASDVIWREIALTRKKKPVVISMGDVAASGGYYVSMGADAIVAQPTTLTGSIGVITGKFSLRGLYDWIALRREQIKRGSNADLFSDYQKFGDSQRALIRAQMRSFYQDFVHKAAVGRERSDDEIDAVGQGRVWTGAQALERSLVDEIGGLERAVELAKEKANIPEDQSVRLEVFPRPKGVLESLLSWGPDESSASAALRAILPREAARGLSLWKIRERLEGEPFVCLEESLLGAF